MSEDDPLKQFTGKSKTKSATASSRPPEPIDTVSDDEEGYAAFGNKVRPVCLTVRCHRTGLEHYIPYAQMGAVTFTFRKGANLYFSGAGLNVTVEGRNLAEIARSLKLHTCALIEDYSPEHGMRPHPDDPQAAFIERITVEVQLGSAPAKPAKQKQSEEA